MSLARRSDSEHNITFIKGTNKGNTSRRSRIKISKSIYLLDEPSYLLKILKFLPKNFTLTTNNGSGQFNIKLLGETSSVISKLLEENPNSTEYHIDVDDKDNVLGKFEQLYVGDHVTFTEEELIVCKKITDDLNIKRCPMYMRPEKSRYGSQSTRNIPLEDGIVMSSSSFIGFAIQSHNQTFKIDIKGQEYICNYFGVLASPKIFDFVTKNPKADKYEYDFSVENDEFEAICDFFNFKIVEITVNNMEFLKEVAEDLQITSIIQKIDDFIAEYEKFSKKIDEQQTKIESIDNIFGWLYDIQKLTVETVKTSILELNWINEEDGVIELAAFILQVINSSFNLHPYLLDLLLQLDKEAKELNKFKILLPFIVKRLMNSFGTSLQNCSFIYNLHKKSVISKEELMNKIKVSYNEDDQRNSDRSNNTNIIVWFMPELIELKLTSSLDNFVSLNNYVERRSRRNETQGSIRNFIKSYYPDKIDFFEKMRDSGETDDALSKAISKDDVDTAQSIVSQSDYNINNFVLPFNIFDDFEENGTMKLINYAAAFGSIKCFKYLFVNHAEVDELTLKFAVYGGNTEIVKIIDQNLKTLKKPLEIIKSTIEKHKNNLFDWILEQKVALTITRRANLLLEHSAINGNAHAFIEIADKFVVDCDFQNLIESACEYGFYRLACLISDISNKASNEETRRRYSSRKCDATKFSNNYASFGNLSIFKFGIKKGLDESHIIESLKICVEKDNKNIFDYILDEILKIDQSQISYRLVEEIATKAIGCRSFYCFTRIFDLVKQIKPVLLQSFPKFITLLTLSCENKSIEMMKHILNIMKETNTKYDITNAFVAASKSGSTEICQYLIENSQYRINNQMFFENIDIIGSFKKDIYLMILNSSTPEIKESFLSCTLSSAISSKNKELIQFLLKEKVEYSNALIQAVNTNDTEVVNIVLDHDSDPEFINQKSGNGTALCIATNNNNLEIVNRLLSIPGIDPNLYDNEDKTPLILSILNFNMDIMNAILDFYGESIQAQTWQLDIAIRLALIVLSSNCDTGTKEVEEENGLRRWRSSRSKKDNNNSSPDQKAKVLTILNRILEIKNIDPNLHGGEHTLLSYACEANEINIVQMLLKTEKIDVNAYAPKNGNTPLMLSIANDNLEIADLLIKDKRTNINANNHDNKTALIFAVEKNLENIVSQLINNEKFNPAYSRLDYAFFISKNPISNLLLSCKSTDVNYKQLIPVSNKRNRRPENESNNSSKDKITYRTPLINAVSSKDIEKVNLIISHPTFDKVKSQAIYSIFDAVVSNNIEIFRILLKLFDNNPKISNYSNSNLLDVAIQNHSIEIIDEIINNEKFIKGDNIVDAFKKALLARNFSADVADKILEFDEKHDHLIDLNKCFPNGQSYLTLITKSINNLSQRILYLLEHGADPNKPDDNGVYILASVIYNKREKCISTLLESNKIDLSTHITLESKKINNIVTNEFDFINSKFEKFTAKYTTYLHLAALTNDDVFRLFLRNETIDINMLDEQGNTPLMYAVMGKSSSIIRLLFRKQDLDYKHVNNDGLNVFNFCKDFDESKIKLDELETKEQYEETLCDILFNKRTASRTRDRNEDKNDQSENTEKDSKDDKIDDENKEEKKDNDGENEEEKKENNDDDEKDENKKENNDDDEKDENKKENNDDDDENNEKQDNKKIENDVDSNEKAPSSSPKKFSFGSKANKMNTSNKNDSNSEDKSPASLPVKRSFGNKTLTVSKNTESLENNYNSREKLAATSHSRFSFGQKKTMPNKNGENEENESNSENKSPATSHSRFSFSKNKSVPNKNSENEENESNSKEKPATTSHSKFTFDQKKTMLNKSGENESNSENKSPATSHGRFSFSKNKSVPNKSGEIEENESNTVEKPAILPIKQQKEDNSFNSFDPQKREISRHLNPGFEQEIESAITNVLKNASPDVVKALKDSIYDVTSRKINSIEKSVTSDENNNDFDAAALELNQYQPVIRQPLDYQNQMMQQQWQQLMQINYNSQYQFNLQMQQMQALQMINENNQSKKKRKNKRKK